MPDLNIMAMGTCRSNVYWKRTVIGSRGDEYTVRFERVNEDARQVLYDYTCDCPDYEIRRAHLPGQYCKHILQVRDERCGWDEMIDGGKTIKGERGMRCPRCEGPATSYMAGV